MRAPIASLYRLMWVQAGWTYERMGGIGVAFAVAPLLDAAVAPEKQAEARARSAEFFNSHPWLAGMAVGASARAERDGVAPEQVRRLRAALGGPLGALGDRVIWAGLVPILSAVAVIGGGLWGWWMPLVAVALAAVLRWEVTRWSLKRGLEHGMRVAAVLKDCTLSRIGAPAGLFAAGAIGLAATFVARGSLARIAPGLQGRYVMLLAAIGLIIVLRAGARLPAYRLALVGGSLVLLLFQAVAP
jgi:PTS system mannose-specific IID component